jgi:DNA-binding NtrC family response regulator
VTTPIRTSSEVEALFAEANSDDRLPAGTEASTRSGSPQAPRITKLRSVCAQFERAYITAVLERHDWRVPDVARALGVDPANLYRKMRRLHISRA